jgi:hypothetical protein
MGWDLRVWKDVRRDAFELRNRTMSRMELFSRGYIDLGIETSELASLLVPRPETIWPVVRTNFANTASWISALTTAPDGTADVEFTLPESLTTWKVKAWTMGLGTKVGHAETEVVTTKDLLVRLRAPRFFVEKDEVVLSANVHNKLKTKKAVQVVLKLDGSVLEPLGESSHTVEIAAGAEHRVDWRVKVSHEGQAVIRMKALTDEESDAAQMSFPRMFTACSRWRPSPARSGPTGRMRRSSCACRPSASLSSHGWKCGISRH